MKLEMKNVILALAMVAGGSAVTTSAVPAHALSGEVCNVTRVAWDEGYGGTLQIFCDGAGRYAFGASTGGTACPIISLDTRKAWLSMAQSALLSGKKLNMNTTITSTGGAGCNGGPGISYVAILQ